MSRFRVPVLSFVFTCISFCLSGELMSEKRGLVGSLVLWMSAVLFAKGAVTEHPCQFSEKCCYFEI